MYEGEAEKIEQALNGKFYRVHIRKPEVPAKEIEALIARIPSSLRHRLSLHDHFELAEPLGIGGIHLNSRNPYPPEGWTGIISRSLHFSKGMKPTPAPEPREKGSPESQTYAFLSPIFPSLSKPGYLPKFTFEEMKAAASPDVFALGGVTFDNIHLIDEAGFGGAAMLTEVWHRSIDPEDFRLQFITHPREDINVVEGARMALAGGCRWIQLRHKASGYSTTSAATLEEEHIAIHKTNLLQEAMAIAELCRQYNATFIIDDHVHLVKEAGADGVHLGKNDMPITEARHILGPSYIIGATANTFAELEAAAQAGADYAGVGPFRFTTTKQKLAPILGTEGYEKIIRLKMKKGIRIPIVAIGGISSSDITQIMATGVNGIAASGAILNAPNPTYATEQLIKRIKKSIKHE